MIKQRSVVNETPLSSLDKLTETDKTTILVQPGEEKQKGAPFSYMAWSTSLEFARKLAEKAGEPFAVFYCSEAHFKVAGETKEVWEAYKKEQEGNAPSQTVFDTTGLANCFATERIKTLVKVADTAENRDLFTRENVVAGTLVFYAPDGEKLASFAGLEMSWAKLHPFIHDDFRQKLERWAQRRRAKEPMPTAEEKTEKK